MRRILMAAVVAAAFGATGAAAFGATGAAADTPAEQGFPAGFFDCLPDPIVDLETEATRGARWPFFADDEMDFGWGQQRYAATGESGAEYTVRRRGISMFDQIEGDEVPDVVVTIIQVRIFSAVPGTPTPSRGWVIERRSYRIANAEQVVGVDCFEQ